MLKGLTNQNRYTNSSDLKTDRLLIVKTMYNNRRTNYKQIQAREV